MLTLQNKIERLLCRNPKMPTEELIREYLREYTNYTSEQREMFIRMLGDAYVPSITRIAAKYREKLGIRDEVRQSMAEQGRRYWPEQRKLEDNPPTLFI